MSRTLTSKPGVDISEWVAESDTVMELCQRMAAYIHTYLPTYLSINQSIYQSINLSTYQSINLSIYQSINLSIYLSTYTLYPEQVRVDMYPYLAKPTNTCRQYNSNPARDWNYYLAELPSDWGLAKPPRCRQHRQPGRVPSTKTSTRRWTMMDTRGRRRKLWGSSVFDLLLFWYGSCQFSGLHKQLPA